VTGASRKRTVSPRKWSGTGSESRGWRPDSVVVGEVEILRRAPDRDAAVVDQDVDVSRLLGQAPDVIGAVELSREEAAFGAGGRDRLHHLSPSLRVAALDKDLRGAVGGQLDRRRAPGTVGRAGDQRPSPCQWQYVTP
jgi:hypothetical protein